MPETVAQIVWVRQLAGKVEETRGHVQAMLGDLAGTAKFTQEADELTDELKANEKELVRRLHPSCVGSHSTVLALGARDERADRRRSRRRQIID